MRLNYDIFHAFKVIEAFADTAITGDLSNTLVLDRPDYAPNVRVCCMIQVRLATTADATNFVDFDTLYGHRRNVAGYAAALEAFDTRLPELEKALQPGDLAVITADHGCDPTWTGSDHTRENVPVLAFGRIDDKHRFPLDLWRLRGSSHPRAVPPSPPAIAKPDPDVDRETS